MTDTETTTAPVADRTSGTRLVALVVGIVDIALLVLAGGIAVATYVALQDSEADPLTAIGFIFAGILAALALVSLLFAWVSTLVPGGWRILCLALAALPILPLVPYGLTFV